MQPVFQICKTIFLLLIAVDCCSGHSGGGEERETLTKCYQGGIVMARKMALENLTVDEQRFSNLEVRHCMGATCTKVIGELRSVVSGVNMVVNMRDCDSLDHSSFTGEVGEASISCNGDKASFARLFMHRVLHTPNLQKTNYKRAYPYPKGQLMNTNNECTELIPDEFPEYKGLVTGNLTFCCCTKRLCNSAVKITSSMIFMIVSFLCNQN